MKVRVPQSSGDIAVSYGGDPAVNYSVSRHTVDVPDEQAAAFVRAVPGAELAKSSDAEALTTTEPGELAPGAVETPEAPASTKES
ncbi:MAG: hypothetical protein M3404_02490 [Actinomycetota bacterium]|nr:hypothetical protein [Actinomycetota bacterium]